jgi:hypothetical protein
MHLAVPPLLASSTVLIDGDDCVAPAPCSFFLAFHAVPDAELIHAVPGVLPGCCCLLI